LLSTSWPPFEKWWFLFIFSPKERGEIMQKIKICVISLCTLLVATGANAAGYTCEELIEYTSCNPGYYLGAGKPGESILSCPEGYKLATTTGLCWDDYNGYAYYQAGTREECLAIDYETDGFETSWISGTVCVSADDMDYTTELVETEGTAGTDCIECSVGSICAGGTAAATECPAGSYCATAGLSKPTNVCAKGSYSLAGATACTSCPASNLTDVNGNAVSVTTESTGSTSSSACFVAKGTLFKDNKGIFRYRDNCAYGNYGGVKTEQQACEADEYGEWVDGACDCSAYGDPVWWNYFPEYGVAECSDTGYDGLSSSCEDTGGTWNWEQFDCVCPDGGEFNITSDDYGECPSNDM